jgi:hypothetical protein
LIQSLDRLSREKAYFPTSELLSTICNIKDKVTGVQIIVPHQQPRVIDRFYPSPAHIILIPKNDIPTDDVPLAAESNQDLETAEEMDVRFHFPGKVDDETFRAVARGLSKLRHQSKLDINHISFQGR